MNMMFEMQQNMTVGAFLLWLTRDLIRTGMYLSSHRIPISSQDSRSQWYVTFRATPHLDKKHTVFGKLVGGEDVLDALEALPVKPGTDRPAKTVRITEVIM